MKNILITLGCSFTHGDGCYDYSILEQSPFNSREYSKLNDTEKQLFYQLNQNNFLNKGWPSQLQEMLGFDELYNLGIGGAANSQSVKIFMDELYYRDFENSNVVVIWLHGFHHRISFYNDGVVKSYSHDSKLHNEYIREISDINTDTRLETYFYLKLMKELCNNKNWKFLYTSIKSNDIQYFNEYYHNDILLDNFMNISIPWPVNKSNKSKICAHPNELGYTDIAKTIYDWIQVSDIKIPNKHIDSYIKEAVFQTRKSFNINVELDNTEEI